MTKKLFCALLAFIVLFGLYACAYEPDPNYKPPEREHLYWKDIDVVVKDVDKRTWFATVHRYELKITVYSEEYDLEKTLHYSGSGMLTNIPGWSAKEGETLKAQLYSWVIDSTGKVVRRDINKIY